MSERQRTAMSVTTLVVAVLGWTTFGQAARRVVFPANSVGTAQLKAQAVTSRKIRERTIVNADIKPGSLLATSFRPGELPAGVEGLEIVTVPPAPDDFDTSAVKTRQISCPAGKKVIGGGGSVLEKGNTIGLTSSYPWDDHTWYVGARRFVEPAYVWGLGGYAICATAK
jgi:hypothetical protein